MFVWEIHSGTLYASTGLKVAQGYSGLGIAKNDPQAEMLPNQGPIPEGKYTIEAPRDTATHGPYVLPLVPDPENEMHGRAGFLIHGDNITHTASEGCIILARADREHIWTSGDHRLEVIADSESQITLDASDL